SMQAQEKYGDLDCDADGKTDEMVLGNVAALTAFVTMTRPPRQVNMNDPSVVRGRAFFTTGGPLNLPLGQTCASCHMPTMRLYSPQLFIETPAIPNMKPSDCVAHPFQQSLTSPESADRSSGLLRLSSV